MIQKILITGASSGFGHLTAMALLERGHRVVASMRDPGGRNREVAEQLAVAGAQIVEIDVTDDYSVEKGARTAVELAGGLDVLVNNAGIGVSGLQECFTPDDWRRLFDINLFGVQRMSRALIPLFRHQRSGLLLYVSSVLGRITIPFYGPYNASKWALEALAENYRAELSAFGIDSCIVEPGGYKTAFIERLLRPSDTSRDRDYGALADAPAESLASFERTLDVHREQDPQNVADAIVRLIEAPAGSRPFRSVVDNMGMGEAIGEYNDHLDQVTAGIYQAAGIGDMLLLKD
jgi:NAD(P)-dependent dehydrogenase (short-subunit alcohol dehydrogenase family)